MVMLTSLTHVLVVSSGIATRLVTLISSDYTARLHDLALSARAKLVILGILSSGCEPQVLPHPPTEPECLNTGCDSGVNMVCNVYELDHGQSELVALGIDQMECNYPVLKTNTRTHASRTCCGPQLREEGGVGWLGPANGLDQLPAYRCKSVP
jgi:hypothetical protein